jgi:hypothetical protein
MAPTEGDPSDTAASLHQGREVCRGVLRQALQGLAAPLLPGASVRDLPRDAWLIDRQFGDWPLNDSAVIDSLSAWLRPGVCRLHLIGLDFDASARALPRFARWRRDWSHRIDVHRPAEGPLPPGLRGLHVGGTAWQWQDAPDWRLRTLNDAMQVRAMQERIADFLQQCEPAWPVTTLGL